LCSISQSLLISLRAQVGNIGAAVGLRGVRTGDTLMAGSERRPLTLPGVDAPPPVFLCGVRTLPSSSPPLSIPHGACQIEAESPSAQAGLDAALEAVQREDPSLTVRTDRDTGQTLLCGMGELHLEVCC
jgi:elongation factor G